MVIEPVLASLRETLQSFEGGTIDEWRNQFGFVHDEWHMPRRRIQVRLPRLEGFLSSHGIVHLTDKRSNGKTLYHALQLQAIGYPFPNEYYQFGDPHAFSYSVEAWHNEVHRDSRFGSEFVDTFRNVHMDVFWQFHQAVEEIYMTYLRNHGLAYEDINHQLV